MTSEEIESIKNILLEETEKCRKDKDYANRLLIASGIYNEDGSLNQMYKEHKRIEKAVQTENIDGEFTEIVNNNFWDLL